MKKKYVSPSVYAKEIAVEPMLAGTTLGDGDKLQNTNPNNDDMFSKEQRKGLWEDDEE